MQPSLGQQHHWGGTRKQGVGHPDESARPPYLSSLIFGCVPAHNLQFPSNPTHYHPRVSCSLRRVCLFILASPMRGIASPICSQCRLSFLLQIPLRDTSLLRSLWLYGFDSVCTVQIHISPLYRGQRATLLRLLFSLVRYQIVNSLG